MRRYTDECIAVDASPLVNEWNETKEGTKGETVFRSTTQSVGRYTQVHGGERKSTWD